MDGLRGSVAHLLLVKRTVARLKIALMAFGLKM